MNVICNPARGRIEILGPNRPSNTRGPIGGMLFGLGPPGGGSPEARVADLLEALDPEVRAIRWGEQIHGRLVASLAPEPCRLSHRRRLRRTV